MTTPPKRSASKFIAECDSHCADCPAFKTGKREDCMCRAYPLNPASYGRSKAATPGPWVRRTGTNLIEGSDGTPVHRVIVENESGESNSRLIAAAPELSRELEAIIDSATDGREIPEWLEERLVGAKAAIQKARGGQ